MEVPVPEPSKGEDYKRNSGNKRKKKQTTQETPQEQQTSTMYAATTPATPAPAIQYAGTLLKCGQCNYHHTGVCQEMQCLNCHRNGHTIRFCRAPTQPISHVPGVEENKACYGCGEAGHYRGGLPHNNELSREWTNSDDHRRRNNPRVINEQR
ncbi:uncharacterized protein LOC111898011 [Lactuca sativa]|uniref:uncharacterized protein LOC111898011 n=1 Tax=Lactuca sativa TaxID=4236 RepID=UPI000CD952E1|nr:uncharacterized protein LOC111898011 [Lactuca sativa]